MKNTITLILLSLLTIILTQCTPSPQKSTQNSTSQLPDRSPVLAQKLFKTENALLIDVRSPREFRQKSLPQSLHIPIQKFENELNQILNLTKNNKDHPIILYCASGTRAKRAKKFLLKQGFTRVMNLGGIDDWPQ